MTHRLPLVTTIVIGIQMIMGGIIVGKDAGFVCPDWPLCHGQMLPALTGLVLLELVHRFSALLVSVLVLATAVFVWRRHRHNPTMMWLVNASLISLLLQVVVGGLIVLLKLPGVTTTIDVINSMLLLACFVYLTVYTEGKTRAGRTGVVKADPTLHGLSGAAWMLFWTGMLAILVGAVFRHTGASEALFGQDAYLASHGQHQPPSVPLSQAMLMIHIVTGVVLAGASVRFLIAASRARRLVGPAWVQLLAVAFQAVLGMVTLGTELNFTVATMHWSMAAVLVGVITWLGATIQLAKQDIHPFEAVATPVVVREPGTVR